jgi:hypothetical protein
MFRYSETWRVRCGVQEIIFTQEFMDKYFMAWYNKWLKQERLEKLHTDILQNLDNPVDYLYKLIK